MLLYSGSRTTYKLFHGGPLTIILMIHDKIKFHQQYDKFVINV